MKFDGHVVMEHDKVDMNGDELGATAQRGRRVTLHNMIVEQIRREVFEGRLPPGTRIPETALCEKFDISRTPLREALKVLASEGLVDLLPNRGAVVRKITIKDVKDLFQMMPQVEALVGQLCATHATASDIASIERMHQRMLEFHQRKRRADYFRINQKIHMALAQASGNRVLLETYERLCDKIVHARYLANLKQSRWNESVEEHEQMMQALRARDGGRLSSILRVHVERTGEAVIAALVEQDKKPVSP